MDKRLTKQARNFIQPLYMNGMHGRMMRLPAPPDKSKEILIIYDSNTTLESIYPFAKDLNKYGGVTVPDLPGFGGMQSFYKISERPTLDNLAAYLAAFIKLRYKHRRLTIIGVSYGFTVATRLLQRYPEIAKRTDMVVSLSGFVHHDDFNQRMISNKLRRYGLSLLTQPLPAWVIKNGFVKPVSWQARQTGLRSSAKNGKKQSSAPNPPKSKLTDMLVSDDLRTYLASKRTILGLNICDKKVDLGLYHVFGPDKQFNNPELEQRLNVIFNGVHALKARPQRANRFVRGQHALSAQVPRSIRKHLAKKS